MARVAGTDRTQQLEWIDARVVAVAPLEAERVAADAADLEGEYAERHAHGIEGAAAGALVDAAGAGAEQAQVARRIFRDMAVAPYDAEAGLVLGGLDADRVRTRVDHGSVSSRAARPG